MKWLLVILLVCAACGSSTKSTGDALARSACGKLLTLEQDAHAGVLTPAELTTRARSIYNDARYSSYKPVDDAATAFAADTAQGKNAAADVDALDSACKPVG